MFIFSRIPDNASPKTKLYQFSNGSHSNGLDRHVPTELLGGGNNSTVKLHGPDTLAHSDSHWTTHADGAVKLRAGTDPLTNGIPAESVVTWFNKTVDANPSAEAMKIKRDGKWLTWSYLEYYDAVRTAAKAFIHLGLEPFHAVGIIGFNSPEWFISDIGAIYAGYVG